MTPPGDRRARLLAVPVLLGVFLVVGLVLAPQAEAHATVVRSSPADGDRLARSPAEVRITYDEQVGLGSATYLHVVDGRGRRVEVGAAYHPGPDGSVVAVRLPPGLETGVYLESWRVISADSHPVAGTIEFAVGSAVLAPAATAAEPVDPVTGAVFAAVRLVGYVGLVLLGGLWVLLSCWTAGRRQPSARRVVWAGWWAAVAASVTGMLLQGPYAAGAAISGVGRLSLLSETLGSGYGRLVLARLALLAAAAMVMRAALTDHPAAGRGDDPGGRRGSTTVLGGCAVLVAVTYADAGHAGTTSPPWLSVTLDALHILAMAAWLGGLVMLVAAVSRPSRREGRSPAPEDDRTAALAATLPAVSRVALVSVLVIAGTGTYAAWRGIGSLGALTTPYALLVWAKVALFAGVLCVANWSRMAAGRKLHETVAEPGRMRRLVASEMLIAAVILGLTSVLVTQPRGAEALAAEQLRPVTGSASLGADGTARLTVDPGRHGAVTVYVSVLGGPRPRHLSAVAALPSQQLGPITLPLVSNGPGSYPASRVLLPRAGTWSFTLVVSTSTFDAVTTAITVPLP